jgi:hypothetical protein
LGRSHTSSPTIQANSGVKSVAMGTGRLVSRSMLLTCVK